MAIVYLGVGSNLGDRRKNIKLAVQKINSLRDTKVVKISKIIETKPVGGPAGQRDYFNAALKVKTSITALNLLKQLKKIERDLGRVKTARFGPRPIDLDILFYGDKTINRKGLKVPHPRIFKREFALTPLFELI